MKICIKTCDAAKTSTTRDDYSLEHVYFSNLEVTQQVAPSTARTLIKAGRHS